MRVESDALNQLVVLQVFEMLDVRWSLLIRTAISTHDELECVASLLAPFSLEFEQLEQVIVLEVLLELGLGVCAVIYSTHCHAFLVNLSTVDFLFDCAHRYESVHYHVFLLSDTEHSVDRLVVVCRIPVRVDDDCPVCASQVETLATNFRSKQCTELSRVLVEVNAHLFTLYNLGISINSHEFNFLSVLVFP